MTVVDSGFHLAPLEITWFKKALEFSEGSTLIINGDGSLRRELHRISALHEARLLRGKELSCGAFASALHPLGPLLNVGFTEGSDIQTEETLLTRGTQKVTRQSEEA